MFDYDLEALAFLPGSKKSRHFRLDYQRAVWLTISPPPSNRPVAGEVKAEAANGNGPVDAVYQAINRIADYNVELVKYSLTAKGHGKDAPGRGYCRQLHPVVAASTASAHRYCRVLRQSHGARIE